MSDRFITIPETKIIDGKPYPFQNYIKFLVKRDYRFGRNDTALRLQKYLVDAFEGKEPGEPSEGLRENDWALLRDVSCEPTFSPTGMGYDPGFGFEILDYIDAIKNAAKGPAHPQPKQEESSEGNAPRRGKKH